MWDNDSLGRVMSRMDSSYSLGYEYDSMNKIQQAM